MSRTYRRRRERHDYGLVLQDSCWTNGTLLKFRIDSRSKEGRRAIAQFHSDAFWTLRSAAPRWYRRIFDHRQRSAAGLMIERLIAQHAAKRQSAEAAEGLASFTEKRPARWT